MSKCIDIFPADEARELTASKIIYDINDEIENTAEAGDFCCVEWEFSDNISLAVIDFVVAKYRDDGKYNVIVQDSSKRKLSIHW